MKSKKLIQRGTKVLIMWKYPITHGVSKIDNTHIMKTTGPQSYYMLQPQAPQTTPTFHTEPI